MINDEKQKIHKNYEKHNKKIHAHKKNWQTMKIKQKIQKKSLRTLENDENTIIKNYTQKKIGKR